MQFDGRRKFLKVINKSRENEFFSCETKTVFVIKIIRPGPGIISLFRAFSLG